MSLWKVSKCSEKQHFEIDPNQLKSRLQTIAAQDNIEIIQLVLQSMLEEISDQGIK